jgi:hypothetical protein
VGMSRPFALHDRIELDLHQRLAMTSFLICSLSRAACTSASSLCITNAHRFVTLLAHSALRRVFSSARSVLSDFEGGVDKVR